MFAFIRTFEKYLSFHANAWKCHSSAAVQQRLTVATVNWGHVRGEVHLAGVARHHVTFEDLLLVQSEAVLSAKDQDLVVHGLAGQPLACSEIERESKAC